MYNEKQVYIIDHICPSSYAFTASAMCHHIRRQFSVNFVSQCFQTISCITRASNIRGKILKNKTFNKKLESKINIFYMCYL